MEKEKSHIVRRGQSKYQNVKRCPTCLMPTSIMSDELDRVKYLWCDNCKQPVTNPVMVPEGMDATR